MKFIISVLALSIIFACSKNSDPLSTNEEESYFGIYLLEDTLITEHQAAQMDINSLVLKNKPWLTNNDIRFYDFSSHCIYLKTDKSDFFDNYVDKFYQFNPILISRPFVIVAGNTRCYAGAFHSGLLSLAPAGPYIDELDVGSFPPDVMHISRAWISEEDIRSNKKLKENLIALDLYQAGLEIELTSFNIVLNSDTSVVDYTFTLRNNDEDDLLVIDPHKMGSELFHYYTNGVTLKNENKPQSIWSEYKEVLKPEPYDNWEIDWFTKIKSNQSITRKVRLKGYPPLPEGNYTGDLDFSNPVRIVKEKRYIDGGRIWIGSVKSNKLEITI